MDEEKINQRDEESLTLEIVSLEKTIQRLKQEISVLVQRCGNLNYQCIGYRRSLKSKDDIIERIKQKYEMTEKVCPFCHKNLGVVHV